MNSTYTKHSLTKIGSEPQIPLLSIGFLPKSSDVSKKNNISKHLGTIFPIFSHIFPICSMGFCPLPLGHHQGRSADGRAVLRSSVREFLVSEAASSENAQDFMGKRLENFLRKSSTGKFRSFGECAETQKIDDWKRMKIVRKIDEDWWLMIVIKIDKGYTDTPFFMIRLMSPIDRRWGCYPFYFPICISVWERTNVQLHGQIISLLEIVMYEFVWWSTKIMILFSSWSSWWEWK